MTQPYFRQICRCNSPYRSRYAPQSVRQQRNEVTMRPTHCKYLNEVKVKQRWRENSPYCLRYWNSALIAFLHLQQDLLQQSLPFMVCAEGCETAEEQSDDEVRTSQVPERREGKTKVIKKQSLPFTVLKLSSFILIFSIAKIRCNSPYRLRYWNNHPLISRIGVDPVCCNSTYRLRYAPKGARQQRSKATMRSAHLKYLSKAKVKQR